MTISAIVATSKNRVIGKDNGIPWYLPDDLKWFKKHTTGHHLVMGRQTFESLGKPLPNRTNVVITRDLFYASTGALVVHSLEEAVSLAQSNQEEELFIAGGGQIYAQSLALWDRLYLTEVEAEVEGDVFFPDWDPAGWTETFCEYHPKDARHAFDFTFRILERVV